MHGIINIKYFVDVAVTILQIGRLKKSLSEWCRRKCCGLAHGVQTDTWVHPSSHPKNISSALEGKRA